MSSQSSLTLSTKLPQLLALSSTFLLAGQTLTLFTFLIPRLLESPTSLMLRQWDAMFQTGKKQGPILALVSAGSFWSLAYAHYSSTIAGRAIRGSALGGKVGAYIGSGMLVLGIVPYTLLFLKGTNNKLLGKVEEVVALKGLEGRGLDAVKEETEVSIEGVGEESAHQLVDRWGLLNLGRGLLVVAGGVLGAWNILN